MQIAECPSAGIAGSACYELACENDRLREALRIMSIVVQTDCCAEYVRGFARAALNNAEGQSAPSTTGIAQVFPQPPQPPTTTTTTAAQADSTRVDRKADAPGTVERVTPALPVDYPSDVQMMPGAARREDAGLPALSVDATPETDAVGNRLNLVGSLAAFAEMERCSASIELRLRAAEQDQRQIVDNYELACESWKRRADGLALRYEIALEGIRLQRARAISAEARLQPEAPAVPADVAGLVDRFLQWPLPTSVCADPCATMRDYPHRRYGTSLLTADEARRMLEYVLGNKLGE